MLFAAELHPAVWPDGQLNLPESGNGVSDLLDELQWELDFYVRMQRPDGHFMTSVKGDSSTESSPSPPSQSSQSRFYFDTTAPSGGVWSGGGVTLFEATANAVRSLAHAALVFAQHGHPTIANGYAAVALDGWAWLSSATPQTDQERRLRVAAAAAIYRLDSSVTSAANLVNGFDWATWDGLAPWSVTPGEGIISSAAWHVLANPSASGALQAQVATAVSEVLVEPAFSESGAYGGMFGGPGNGWDWGWGSNRSQAFYGANLMLAVQYGAIGNRSEAEVVARAQQHLHYLLGLNPLNMVYLTTMAAYGGEHSSFQLYHAWFSHTGDDGDNGNAQYNGRPQPVTEPLYPYHPDDDAVATYGPAPGLLVGGPNAYYSCSYDIPNSGYPAYAYRDFSVSCDWDGNACRACSWEITEPMAAYQGPLVLLLSFFMAD